MNKIVREKTLAIQHWFDCNCNCSIKEHRAALQRAAGMIWERQTLDERINKLTKYNNGRGYNGYDVRFANKIVHWNGIITETLAIGAKKMLRKYARQIAEISLGFA